MKKRVYCLLGMCGAGKSAAAEEFKTRGLPGIYFGQITLDELHAQKLSLSPEHERQVREGLRANEGMAVFAKRSLPKIKTLLQKHSKIYIDGLYSFEEYSFLHKELSKPCKSDELKLSEVRLILVEVYADKKLRHARLAKRPKRPLHAKQSEERDFFEVSKLNKAMPIALSDYKIENNGSVESLKKNITLLLEKTLSD